MIPTPGVEPSLQLSPATTEEYCQAILKTPGSEMWWFQTGTAPQAGYSRPFQDGEGRWWWMPRPRFAWPVDFFSPITAPPRIPKGKGLFGWQYPVDAAQANSLTRFNVIRDLTDFDLKRIASQKHRAVRKGLKGLSISPLDLANSGEVEEARIVWNSHVQRTSWNTEFDAAAFAGHWQPLRDTPGTNVLGARDAQTGQLCAWVIARLVGGTAYIDTIASHTDRLEQRPNDTIIYITLYNAARTSGIRQANYFLRSDLEALEKFKSSLGFDSDGLPSWLHVHTLVGFGLRWLKPAVWRRLKGETG